MFLFKRKDLIIFTVDFRKQRQIKFAARSLKIQLHQINLLILLCSLKAVYDYIKTLRQKNGNQIKEKIKESKSSLLQIWAQSLKSNPNRLLL